MWNKNWKKGIDYPNWGDTDVSKKTSKKIQPFWN